MFLFLVSCSQHKNQKLSFLEGTWKVENKQQFEQWERVEDGLKGKGYKLVDGKEQTLETLVIKEINGRIVYQATVINQNNGATISFPLNEKISDYYSFENPEHDFPKKIQYFKLEENKLKVSVLGENGKGFTFIMDRVRE